MVELSDGFVGDVRGIGCLGAGEPPEVRIRSQEDLARATSPSSDASKGAEQRSGMRYQDPCAATTTLQKMNRSAITTA